MGTYKPHLIWIEQCEAARSMRSPYGIAAAFDYLVSEKLLNFAWAAARYPDFARELPSFVSEVRLIFSPSEIRDGLSRMEARWRAEAAALPEDDETAIGSPEALAERASHFDLVKELLTAPALGTS